MRTRITKVLAAAVLATAVVASTAAVPIEATESEAPPGVLAGVPRADFHGVLRIEAPTVIENLNVHGRIQVRSNDVTLRNIQVIPTKASNVSLIDVNTVYVTTQSLLIEHLTIDTQPEMCERALNRGNFTLRRSFIRGCVDGATFAGRKSVGNVLVEDNIIESRREAAYPLQHADGFELRVGENFVFRRNRVSAPWGPFQMRGGKLRNILIEDNIVTGGVHSVRIFKVRSRRFGDWPHEVHVANNTITDCSWNDWWLSNVAPTATFEGNVTDTGRELPLLKDPTFCD
jgi:hypothetical protein